MNRNVLIGTIVVAVLIVVGVLLWRSTGSDSTDVPTNETGGIISEQLSEEESDATVVTATSAGLGAPIGEAPSLDRVVVIKDTYTASQRSSIDSSIKITKATLRSDPGNFDAWIDLGNQVSTAGDSLYAVAIFEYVSLNVPSWAIPESNLGMVYGYYLHDNAKAELHFREALRREPTVTYYWLQTYQFFVDTDQTQKAKIILEQAIKLRVKDWQELQKMLDAMK